MEQTYKKHSNTTELQTITKASPKMKHGRSSIFFTEEEMKANREYRLKAMAEAEEAYKRLIKKE